MDAGGWLSAQEWLLKAPMPQILPRTVVTLPSTRAQRASPIPIMFVEGCKHCGCNVVTSNAEIQQSPPAKHAVLKRRHLHLHPALFNVLQRMCVCTELAELLLHTSPAESFARQTGALLCCCMGGCPTRAYGTASLSAHTCCQGRQHRMLPALSLPPFAVGPCRHLPPQPSRAVALLWDRGHVFPPTPVLVVAMESQLFLKLILRLSFLP